MAAAIAGKRAEAAKANAEMTNCLRSISMELSLNGCGN
jgi:hypothetical protein